MNRLKIVIGALVSAFAIFSGGVIIAHASPVQDVNREGVGGGENKSAEASVSTTKPVPVTSTPKPTSSVTSTAEQKSTSTSTTSTTATTATSATEESESSTNSASQNSTADAVPKPEVLSPDSENSNNGNVDFDSMNYPKSSIVAGQMRSDREEVPGGFTKAQADKAETMEAELGLSKLGGCQIFWPSPNPVCGAILDKYNELGGVTSFLLYPRTNELTNPDGVGKRTEFIGGTIYWHPSTGAHYMAHDFLLKWSQHGYEAGWMGYPMTDQIINLDGGRRQQFQGGHIYWSPVTGAHSINGRIYEEWGNLGYENGYLGYPLSDEINPSPGLSGLGQRMSVFLGGALIWEASTNLVHELERYGYGSIPD